MARKEGRASGFHGLAEGPAHSHGISRGGDARVHEAGGRAHLHGFAGLRGAAYASIDHHGQFGIFDEYAQHLLGAQAAVRSYGCAKRHDGRRTGIAAGAGYVEVGIDVGQDGEAFTGKDLGSLGGFVAVDDATEALMDDYDDDYE